MGVTATTDVIDWIPDVISAALYDMMYESWNPLTMFATPYGDLQGRPGDSITIPNLAATTPAANLAQDVAATDDKLTSGGVTLTVKEGVKSIAWYDRTQVQAGQDVNQIAGGRVGQAMDDRIELDLGAAAVAGRDATKDTAAGSLTLATLRTIRGKMPAKFRRRGQVNAAQRPRLFGEADVLDALLGDTTVLNAAAFGSDEALREGSFSRPILGVTPVEVDDGTLPEITAGKKTVLLIAPGMLVKAFQRNPRSETERDARARLTRIVGTVFHGEGVVDSRGIVAGVIG